MALDAATLFVTANELKKQIIGARVDKLYMPTRDEALFSLRTQGGIKKLLVSARSGSARVHITAEDFENPAVPPTFCMLLRKHLGSGRITDVRTVDGERILFIDFDAMNEMGDRVAVTMSVELMGRYSNIVLVNESGKVIDALKRIDSDTSDVRQLVPGITFTMPPTQDKLNFLSCSAEELTDRVTLRQLPLSNAILSSVAGIGPVLCREISHRVCENDIDADGLSTAQKQNLSEVIAEIQTAAHGDGMCLNSIYDGRRPIEFSFVKLTQYGECELREFETISELLDCYYSEKDRAERMKARSFDLSRQVNSLYDRAVRKQQARLDESRNTEKAEQKRLFGELVQANLHNIQKGEKSALLLNYYTGETVSVPLDATKNPIQNAQKYFKDYRKLTTAAKMLETLLTEGETEIQYLQSVKYEITEARTEEDFILIRKELKDAGYLRGFKYREQKRPRKMSEFLQYKTSDGFTVLVGRNNAANEKLTLKTASKQDIWFHVKNAAGSHTVLITESSEPTEAAMTQAACIAAYHSSITECDKTAVDYTAIKNVKKAPSQKPGMVIYTSYKTAFVTPIEKEIEALKMK
ncbi:MAG: NFACT RNA binding domain-containing protein [Oscillospiraceae bacterium]